MTFLATRPLEDGLQLLFQIDGQNFDHVVSRTVLGIGFPTATDYGQTNHAYACVAAERTWPCEVDDHTPPERQYIIIDEAECMLMSELIAHCVRLKDKYLCSGVFCPNDPPALVDSIKRAEGLSYYDDDPPHVLRDRHPSFASTLYRASVREVKVDIEAARKDINAFLDAHLMFPGTGIPIYGNSEEPQRKLITLASGTNFKTDLADQAVQRSEPKYIAPVWLAASGLDRSMARGRPGGPRSHTWEGSAHSGY